MIEKVADPWASPIRSLMARKAQTVGKTMHELVFWGQKANVKENRRFFIVTIGTKCKTVLSREQSQFSVCVVLVMFNFGGLAETPDSLSPGVMGHAH